YETISYVWGSNDKPCSLLTPDGVVSITENLHSVLRDLRLVDRPRCLWADEICINQEDIAEKEYQVTMMADIYRFCRRVLVYLGPAAEEASLAFKYLRYYQKSRISHGILSESRLSLIQSPWFHRAWTKQEFILGR
ncbi:hypothetical protein OIDMADRAFT_84463, partial [Oidiodendron maius Zn]